MHLPEKYIRDAIHNPLLFQENNPLISESMSLLNSRHKGDDSREMEEFSSKEMSARMRRKYDLERQDRLQESSQGSYDDHSHVNQEYEDEDNNEVENERAIKEFEREIEEKFKISVANKIYTFPRLKITSIMDIISSSEEEDNEGSDIPSKSTSQLTETQFNPFDPKHYNKKLKTEQYEAIPKLKNNSQKDSEDRNFKKVKISDKKDKDKKNSSLKMEKDEHPNYSHREKPKNPKKNPEVFTTSKEKNKTKNQTQKVEKTSEKMNSTKNQKPWAVKESKILKTNYAERLKTEMDNGSSGMSESITESKKRFYEEEFCLRK